jgi:glutamine synthetase
MSAQREAGSFGAETPGGPHASTPARKPILDIDAAFGRKTVPEIQQGLRNLQVEYVKVGMFDIDGILRGKYMKVEKFLSALEKGFGFCDVVLGWDSNDQLYDSATHTGWHTAYPDAELRIAPETVRALPFEENVPLFLAEMAGRGEAICPRGLLRRVVNRAAGLGFTVSAAVEFEFFLFNETPESVRAKHYQDLRPITPGNFGYSVLRSSVHSEFYHSLLGMCRDMRIPLEGLHTETGPGVVEAAILYDDALESADRAALFKTFTKVLCQRRGWMASFMAKWSNKAPGQSGHLHMSLREEKSGRPAFFDENGPHGMSETMRWFVGGQQALMPELLAMVACTVNSYSRLVPGYWAPINATWGVDNRTTALRVVPGEGQSQRVEYRIAAADINPYLALAASIGSGLWGIEQKIEPSPPVEGNAYERKFPDAMQLPATLTEAAGRLRQSMAARELFGREFVEHYAQSREWEEREFRKHITDWELARYFEII